MPCSNHSGPVYNKGRFRPPTTHFKHNLKATSLISLHPPTSPSIRHRITKWLVHFLAFAAVDVLDLSAHMYCDGRSPHTKPSAGFTARTCAVAVPIPHFLSKRFSVRTVQHIIHFRHKSARRRVDRTPISVVIIPFLFAFSLVWPDVMEKWGWHSGRDPYLA